jgi:hypothetical protein
MPTIKSPTSPDSEEIAMPIICPETLKEARELELADFIVRIEERLIELSEITTAGIKLGEEWASNKSPETRRRIRQLCEVAHNMDDALCEFGSYFQVLVSRAAKAAEREATGDCPMPKDALVGLHPERLKLEKRALWEM